MSCKIDHLWMKHVYGNSMNKYICVTGGGTGGHLSVARSLIDEFYARGFKIIYIGSTKGADQDWFENYPHIERSYFLQTSGVVNKKGFGKLFSLLNIIQQAFYCIKLFKQYQIEKIISVGGFSAAAASFGAILSNKQLFIHEQNSVMGSLNKITSKFAKELFSSYDTKALIKDYPINPKFFAHQRVRTQLQTIIFLGGSQGSRAINDFALQVAPILVKNNINIIHQTGKNDFERIKLNYEEQGIEATVFDFSPNILEYMNKSDFAISRSGASTLWELCALGLPALFIPYPYAASDHQYHNAKFLKDQNLALLERENQLNTNIINQIQSLSLNTLSSGLINSIKKDGVKKIADKIEAY